MHQPEGQLGVLADVLDPGSTSSLAYAWSCLLLLSLWLLGQKPYGKTPSPDLSPGCQGCPSVLGVSSAPGTCADALQECGPGNPVSFSQVQELFLWLSLTLSGSECPSVRPLIHP